MSSANENGVIKNTWTYLKILTSRTLKMVSGAYKIILSGGPHQQALPSA
jgi:hypothetical protein